MIDKSIKDFEGGEAYILDIPYANEIEVCYSNKETQKYIRLRYDKRKVIEWGETAWFIIENDIRNSLKESKDEN